MNNIDLCIGNEDNYYTASCAYLFSILIPNTITFVTAEFALQFS